MHNTDKPHIGVTFPENFPDQIIEIYKAELIAPGLRLDIKKVPFGGPYASFDWWAIPTLIGAYLLKSYFDGFLKETGKDHYLVLTKWLKKLSSESRGVKVTTISAEQSTDKLDQKDTQSKVFSIQTRTNAGDNIKFLFDDALSNEDWAVGIEKVIKLLDAHFTNGVTDELTIEIKNNKLEKTIYGKLKTDTIEWEFLDQKKILNARLEQNKDEEDKN